LRRLSATARAQVMHKTTTAVLVCEDRRKTADKSQSNVFFCIAAVDGASVGRSARRGILPRPRPRPAFLFRPSGSCGTSP
jgi:hypothetical protein